MYSNSTPLAFVRGELPEIAWENIGVDFDDVTWTGRQPNLRKNLEFAHFNSNPDLAPAGITVWDNADNGGSEMDEDSMLELVGAARIIMGSALVTELGIDPYWLLSEDDVPMGVNTLALLESVIRDAILVGEKWQNWCDEMDPWTVIEVYGQRLEKAADKIRTRQAVEAKRRAKVEAARKRAEREAKRIAEFKARRQRSPQVKSAQARKTETGRDWMGRMVGSEGATFFTCTSRVKPRYGNGPGRPCPEYGPASHMVTGPIHTISRRQGGSVVEVWHLANHALCPACADRISKSMKRKGSRTPQWQTIEKAISRIEDDERALKHNNTLQRAEGMTEPMRPTRFCVVVDWASDDSWKALLGRCRGGADWTALRESLQIGSLDLVSLSKKLVPAWECEDRTDTINWHQLCKLEREQRAWQERQRQREARHNAWKKRNAQRHAQA